MASNNTSVLIWVLLVSILGTIDAQQAANQKLNLAKNTVVPLSSSYRSINGAVYQAFLIDLYLGADGKDNSPTQKGPFALAFNTDFLLMTQYCDDYKQGFNVTESLGFDQTSDQISYVWKGGVKYAYKDYRTWVRLSADQKVNSNVPKSALRGILDTPTWVRYQLGAGFGMVGLSSQSDFFQALIQTYKPAQGDTDRIPVSWSLNPENEAYIFDSRASFKGDTFILNGFRSTGKQFGKSVSLINGIWHFPGMSFKMGSRWNATNKTVCIDPNADATIAVPSSDLTKIWEIIQADICNGNKTTDCNYAQVDISKMTNFEVSFETTDKFQPQVTLKGSDIIKADSKNNFMGKGISLNRDVSSVCGSDTIVLGSWFFTKAELVFWVSTKDPKSILLSFSHIELDGGKSKWGILLIILLIVAIIALAVIGYFVWIKIKEKYGIGSKYSSSSHEDSSIGSKTFEG
jgi:hypothetical protein